MWFRRRCNGGGEIAFDESLKMSLSELLTVADWDWSGILRTAVGAGIGSAIVQGGYTLYKDHRAKQDHAVYLALRIAVTLEAYASSCLDLIFRNSSMQDPPDRPYPDWDGGLPELPNYPEDLEGWRSMKRELVARALNFRNKIDGSQGLLNSAAEFGNGEDLIHEIDEQAASRGIEAWEIATSLRKEYSLMPSEVIFDYPSVLRSRLAEAIATKAELQRRQSEMIKAMSSTIANCDQT
jgi:hypothetical protein